MIYGVFELVWWQYVVLTLVLTHITIAAVTIFLHRHQAHRALDLHPIVSHFFRAWLWLTTGMETKAWAAIHRKHHAKCETPDDPHSPQILGIRRVLLEGAELYRKEKLNDETLERYGQGTPDDWMERHIYCRSARGILVTLAIQVILFGVPGLIMWAAQMAWIPFFAAGVVNGLGHYVGYRNYECPDEARNLVPWGILIGGEELHNNHHSYPTSAKLSNKWWEFDIGWLYIKLMASVGLAKVKRVAPKPQLKVNAQLDGETLTAIITNRIHVMTHYTKEVLLPIFDAERVYNRAAALVNSQLWRQTKAVLGREDSLVDAKHKEEMLQVLETTPDTKEAYHLRVRLRDIWSRTTASQKELLEALHEWCHQAESSKLASVRDFSQYLRSYALAG